MAIQNNSIEKKNTNCASRLIERVQPDCFYSELDYNQEQRRIGLGLEEADADEGM